MLTCAFVDWCIQHANRMRHIIICGLPGCSEFLNIISRLSKNIPEKEMRVLILSVKFVWNISYYKKKWARYGRKNVYFFHVKCPSVLSDFNYAWIFSTYFRKIFIYPFPTNSGQLEPNLMFVRPCISNTIIYTTNWMLQ